MVICPGVGNTGTILEGPAAAQKASSARPRGRHLRSAPWTPLRPFRGHGASLRGPHPCPRCQWLSWT